MGDTYQKQNSTLLRSNASALTRNVSVLSADVSPDFQLHIAVIHKSSINIVKPNAERGSPSSKEIICKDSTASGSNVMVLQTKWCTVNGQIVMVVCYQRGVQIFDWDGSVLLFWHVFGNHCGADKKETFARGIATCGTLICVGSHNGEILMFDVSEKATITHIGCSKRDKSDVAIADLASQDNFLISADNRGIITVWKNTENNLKQMLNITNKDNDSCSVITCWKNMIISGHSDGMVRMYDLHEGNLMAEIAAHTKWISSIDIAPLSGLLCTSSEDSYVRIWQIFQGKKFSVTHKHSECIQDLQLCGVSFCDSKGQAFCTTGYDQNELLFYSI